MQVIFLPFRIAQWRRGEGWRDRRSGPLDRHRFR
jgi:hypothetical protein